MLHMYKVEAASIKRKKILFMHECAAMLVLQYFIYCQ
jgi:hypothetical protein